MPVYFIQAGEGGPVKIGHAANPRQRLAEIQVAHHSRLTLLRLVVGAGDEEACLHSQFAEQRIRGEWFQFVPAMLGDIGMADVDLPTRAQATALPFLPWQVRGATKEVAARLGISSAAVSQWRTAAGGIPEKHRATVRAVIADILARHDPIPRDKPADAA